MGEAEIREIFDERGASVALASMADAALSNTARAKLRKEFSRTGPNTTHPEPAKEVQHVG